MPVKNRLLVLMGEKQARENRPITQSVVAKETGLSRQSISEWAQGKINTFKGEIIEKLCRYFGVTVGELLYIEDEPQGELVH